MRLCQYFTITAFLLFLLSKESNSQIFGKYVLDPIPSAISNASLWLSSNNPANELEGESMNFLCRISPNKYGIKELTPAELKMNFEISENHFINSSIFYIGNKLFNEYSVEIGYSTAVSERILIGVSTDYGTMSFDRFSSQSAWSIHLGCKLSLSEKLESGFYLRNLLKSSYGNDSLYTWQTAVIGISYQILDNVHLDADALIDITRKSSFCFAFKYSFQDFADFRFGWRNYPSFMETGIIVKNIYTLNFIFLAQFNSVLGISPMIGIAFGL